ncbi:hypothetical protein Tsubulata_006133 [Turnera subulata]|uniref:RNA polymerase II-associated protein 1 C-terminal domain-containing protein n=1 Tax=Turnera subulata TaxID=218843 RepID=A0A9Q0J277_9ROSI|nr:hypothetical protein Tsubulata_006133 [Turnera subulata]
MEGKSKKHGSIRTYDSSSAAPVERILGQNKLQVGEVNASSLVGSVVEKGVSLNPQTKPTPPPPQLTVLPFPVARHRSHGPHFGPIKSGKDGDGDSEDDEEDNDPVSSFAKPVERKQKKGLNLSRWRELMQADEVKENQSHVKKSRKPRAVASKNDMEIDNSHKDDEGMSNNGSLGALSENVDGMDPVLRERIKRQEQATSSVVSSSSVSNYGNEQGSTSLESDIDAENRSRLQSMSAEEIAEAQAEIMQKMKPGLLDLLKKRGREKLKMQKRSTLGESIDGPSANNSGQDQSYKGANVPPAETDSSYGTTKTSQDTRNGMDIDVAHNSGLASGSLWDIWRKRVEAVRGLRFSLQGDIVADESGTDNGYNVGNVAQRDILRTEGDPDAAGYTIKEAVQLSRSVIPLQRVFALQLLSSVLEKALYNIQQNLVGSTFSRNIKADMSIDWEAIWAFALGPEPELALALRMCLDDNHVNVVVPCVKVIQSALSCDLNEIFFEISEKIATSEENMFTAPVFRSKPEIDVGFLRGGFWKYNAKPSNILRGAVGTMDDETEGTIQDDIFLAGQDFAAGLVRMGILPRILFILEGDPTEVLREGAISILIAMARHSPTCANAIVKYERLVHLLVDRFINKDYLNIYPSHIKAARLLKVLAQSDKKSCAELIKNGLFEAVTLHLYRYTSSLDQWVKSGKEKCKLSSALMIEQLRFWKVCICYGFSISYFSDIFPALCLWLSPPTFRKLQENSVLGEFVCISNEVYLVLGALARKLPNLYSQNTQGNKISDFTGHETETWSWNYVTPVVDLALKWIPSRTDPYVSEFIQWQKGSTNDSPSKYSADVSLWWVYSSALHMLSAVLEKIIPVSMSLQDSGMHLPWLPEFVPKIGLEIIKNRFLSFPCDGGIKGGIDVAGENTFIEELCLLRQQGKYETSLASVCCLKWLLQVITSVDKLIHLAKSEVNTIPFQGYGFSREAKILEEGLVKGSLVELRCVLNLFMRLMQSEWHVMQSIEMFGRGGPSPGVGLGWGASGGGFWSLAVLLYQTDAQLLIHLLEIFPIVPSSEAILDEEMAFAIERINSVLGVFLTAGPRDRFLLEKALDIFLQVPVLKYLDFCTQRFLQLNKIVKQLGLGYKTEDHFRFSAMLKSHFKSRWFSVKRKLKAIDDSNPVSCRTSKKGNVSLATIYEDVDMSNVSTQDRHNISLTAEWAYQKLPLPVHWFLSPITTISSAKEVGLDTASNTSHDMQESRYLTEIAKGGLFLLLGMEAMSTFLPTNAPSPVYNVPLMWKIHSLSSILINGMGVLEDDKSRTIYEGLQDLYGHLLDEARSKETASHTLEDVSLLPEVGKKPFVEFLKFQSEIHQSYSTFLETLVEQFAAISYGDLAFGRQVAVYLHRCNEAPVRLAAWNTLVDARVLELLPPSEKCFGAVDGYLEPVEDKEDILEAYAKSWTSGALDRAVTRGSMAYTLVLCHLSSFIFHFHANDKSSLLNKLAKSLLRDYSAKLSHEGMMLALVGYNNNKLPAADLPSSEIQRRFEVLVEACERDSSLLTAVEKLRSAFAKKQLVIQLNGEVVEVVYELLLLLSSLVTALSVYELMSGASMQVPYGFLSDHSFL